MGITADIEKKIIDIFLKYEPSLKNENIRSESRIFEDLGIDSLSIQEISFDFEDEFDLVVMDNDIEKFRTIGDIVEFIIKEI